MICASAPGSIMITGEHAVVYGHNAIVAAVEQRISVTLTPRQDDQVRITSEIADPLETALSDVATGGPYKFVLAAVAMLRAELPSGFDLSITSQIDPTLGLGSSAAVTIASLGALLTFCDMDTDAPDVHAKAHQIILDIQGRGSGADLAASAMGGMIAYGSPPQVQMDRLPAPPELSLCYCGYKTPTAVVLEKIAKDMEGHEATYDALYAMMGEIADATIKAAQSEDWAAFADLLNAYQTKMEQLGVCDETLAGIISKAQKSDGLKAAKISGSGLGDCVLAVGRPPEGFEPVKLAEKGLIIHV